MIATTTVMMIEKPLPFSYILLFSCKLSLFTYYFLLWRIGSLRPLVGWFVGELVFRRCARSNFSFPFSFLPLILRQHSFIPFVLDTT